MNTVSTRYQIDLIHRATSETAARSLEVLAAIEQTIDSLRWLSDKADADTTFLVSETEHIKAATPVTYLDTDDSKVKALEQVQEALSKSYAAFSVKRNAAIQAPELTPDDGVADAYTEAMKSLGDLHDAIDDLRWAIMLHDGQLDKPSTKTYSSVDSMFDDILV